MGFPVQAYYFIHLNNSMFYGDVVTAMLLDKVLYGMSPILSNKNKCDLFYFKLIMLIYLLYLPCLHTLSCNTL